jgi:hypothetical protein
MVLSGVIILLGIITTLSGNGDLFRASQWTYAGIHEIFLAVILLGLFLGWCFPAKIKKYCPALFVAWSVALFLLANLYLAIGEHKEIPQEMKLVDCSGKTLNIRLAAPKGRRYGLVLEGLPEGRMTNGNYISSYKFTGHLRITTRPSETIQIPLDSDTMSASPGELNLGPVNLRAGKDYDLQIEFDPPPPTASFISFYWAQSYADRNN